MQDYRRAGFASRNMVFLMGNYTGPFNITFNPFLIAQVGRPYNFVTPNDLTGDNFFNNRPSIVAASNCTSASTQYVQTAYGCFDAIPPPGETDHSRQHGQRTGRGGRESAYQPRLRHRP